MASAGLDPYDEDDTYLNRMEPPYLIRKEVLEMAKKWFKPAPNKNTGYPEVSHQSQYS